MRKVVNLIGPLCKDISLINPLCPSVLVDGGAKWRDFFKNSISVGDGDSLRNDAFLDFDYPYPTEKDETDLSLALKHLVEHFEFDEIMAYGLSGERLDHELANFFEIMRFMEHFRNKSLHIIGDSLVCSVYSPGEYEFFHQGVFSLFTFKKGKIKLTGDVKYPIENQKTADKLVLSGLGLSNFATGKIKLSQNVATLYFPMQNSL